VAYAAHFAVDLGLLPEPPQQEIRRIMDQVAEALDGVAASNPFWVSARNSQLMIDVAGYRVVYRIDAARHEVIVVEVSPLRSGR
jgi:mRNA-degrading endonuclease RelE of RelBE toxin-antitoxin system